MSKALRIWAVLALFLSLILDGQSCYAQTSPDEACPRADGPVSALSTAVGRSPHHATAEIGHAAKAVYEAYVACSTSHRKAGDNLLAAYAATEAADMFVFAAHDYAALGDDQVAVSVLHRGLTFVSSALADLQPPDKFRRQLVHSQQEMHDLLSGLE